MSNSRGGLGTLEYVSVAGAVVGSAIAFITNQVIFGLAPVSLSLVLNLINRRRLETFLDHNADATTEVQQLRRDLTLLRTTNDKVTQDIQNLVPRQELTSTVSRVEEIHQQQEGLRLSLVPLQSRLDDLIQQFNHRPELEEIESLALIIEALKQSIDQLPQSNQSLTESPQTERVEHLQKAIDLLQYQFNYRPELVELKSLSDVTEALQESIAKLSNSQQSSLREIQQVANSLKQLPKSEQVERLQKAIDLLQYQFNYRPELVELKSLSDVTEALQELSSSQQSSLREMQQQVASSLSQIPANTTQVERLQKALNLLEHQLERQIWQLHQDWAAQNAGAENK